MNQHTRENGVNRVEGFAVGLLVGSVAGAGAMLLLAPQSGKKTRAQIQHKSDELRNQMGKTVDEATSQVRSKAREININLHKQAEALEQRGQDAIDEQRDNLGASLKDLGETVHT